MTVQLALLASSFVGDLWTYLQDYGSELAAGLRWTIQSSAVAIVGAFFIGLVLGAARAHRIPVVSQLAAVYVEIIRNTPLLVQIFFLYFGLATLGTKEVLGFTLDFRLDAFTVAWLSVMIWGGAFNTENFRAGFEAVPHRYREAGFAVGLRPVAG